MRILIVSDIHSNLEAFESVLDDADGRGGFDEIWSLGDLVGYGPDPAAVIDALRERPHRAVVGNHDLAAIGELSLDSFNDYAAAANRWTADALDDDRRRYLSGQPRTLEIDEFTLAHGSPRDPIWEYVVSPRAAAANFNYFDTYRCLVGHSHVPFICRPDERAGALFMRPPFGTPYPLEDDRFIINPGSVGQPRDRDARASYAVYDSDGETLTHYRVEYDIPTTQDKMRSVGLPAFLIDRLAYGQ